MGDKEIIKNLVYLAKNLTNLQDVLIHLVQEGIISRNEQDEIESVNTPMKRNDKLLAVIDTKDWHRVRNTFLEILRQTNNEHCADKIEVKETQATLNKRNERETEYKKTRKCEKICKWWPDENRLIESLHQRRHGEKLLVEELHDRIENNKNQTVVICESAEANKYSGMGGMGKTLTAKWYAHHYEEHYDHILWIDCGEGSLIKSFESLARDLEVKNWKDLQDVKEFKRKCFESLFEFKCLWIYDNAESYKGEEGIIKVLPHHPNFFCMITSRSRKEWGVKNGYGKISELQLGRFSQEESLEFLNKELDEEIKRTEFDLNELCRLLGNLPLALQLAVAALNNSHMDVKTYIEKNKFVKVLDAEFDDYEKTINGNVKVSLDLIGKQEFGTTASEILMIISYIRHDNIKLEYFKSALQIKDEREIKESVKLLRKYSLIARTKRLHLRSGENRIYLSIHRLLQQVVRHNGKEKEKEIVRKILDCEGFVDYKLLPFTKYADEDLKKEFPKVKAQLLDQKQLRILNSEKRFEECVQLAMFIDQELKTLTTKLNYGICQHLNGQVEECLKTAEELLAEFPLTVKDNQLSKSLEQMLVHLKRVNLTVDIKRNWNLIDLGKENKEELREEVGDFLLFSYLRLNKTDKAIAIVRRTASHKGILSILTAVMAQKRFKDCVQLAKLIDEEFNTNTTKLNYAICLQTNRQWEESVATLNELDEEEIEEEIKYGGYEDEMGLLRLHEEVSRELVGGHLLLAYWALDNKEKIEDLLKKRKQFKVIYSEENLDILIRLVHSDFILCNYSLATDSFPSLIDLRLDQETKKIELWRCSLSLCSFDRLSPEELTLSFVYFFRDGQKLEEVQVNDFIDLTNIKQLTLECDLKKNLILDLSGDVSIDYLELIRNVQVLNWNISNWNVKELHLRAIPFVKTTSMKIQEMTIWNSSLDVPSLPPTLQKLTLRIIKKFRSGGVELPMLTHLTLRHMKDVGCLCHFHSAPLTHLHLESIEEINVDLLPPTLTHLQITIHYNRDIRVIGGVRRVDNLRLVKFSFEGVEKCLSHLNTQNLLIHYRRASKMQDLAELMKKQIQKIALGPIQWNKDDFNNYSSQLHRGAGYYLLEGERGSAMEKEEFKKLLEKDFPLLKYIRIFD